MKNVFASLLAALALWAAPAFAQPYVLHVTAQGAHAGERFIASDGHVITLLSDAFPDRKALVSIDNGEPVEVAATACFSGGCGVNSVSVGGSGNVTNSGTSTDPILDLIASPSVTSIITSLTGTGLQQASNCALTTTNASPSLVTLTGWNCKLTSGSATAVVFTITLAHTYTNAPTCHFTPAITPAFTTATNPPSCTTTTTTATLTYSAAPTAVLLGSIVVFANGP